MFYFKIIQSTEQPPRQLHDTHAKNDKHETISFVFATPPPHQQKLQLIRVRESVIKFHKEISQDRKAKQGGQHDGADPIFVRPRILASNHVRTCDIYPKGVAAKQNRHGHHDQPVHHRPLIRLSKSMNVHKLGWRGCGDSAGKRLTRRCRSRWRPE